MPEKQKVSGYRVAGITEFTGCTVDNSVRMWTAEGPRLGKAGLAAVIHFSTAPSVHRYTAAD
jgi:hypothetical protein